MNKLVLVCLAALALASCQSIRADREARETAADDALTRISPLWKPFLRLRKVFAAPFKAVTGDRQFIPVRTPSQPSAFAYRYYNCRRPARTSPRPPSR
jgi:hypothetical protein